MTGEHWLLAIYGQHPEAVAPMPAMPDVPAPPAQARSAVDPARSNYQRDATIADGSTPLTIRRRRQGQIICFLAPSRRLANFPRATIFAPCWRATRRGIQLFRRPAGRPRQLPAY
jgi:hypothetical protein